MTQLSAVFSALRSRTQSAVAVLAVAASAAGLPLPAMAANGYVTTNESAIEHIYSVNGYTFDFVFLDTQTLVSNNLLTIDTQTKFDALDNSSVYKSGNFVNLFYVDTISWCGGTNTSIVGCGYMPGNVVAVESSFAASASLGANLLAHEIGHNLGLDHSTTDSNLMYGTLTSSGNQLTSDQMTTILKSPLLTQTSTNHYTITVNPIAVVAAAVPEPETWLMFTVGLIGLAGVVRRRQAQA